MFKHPEISATELAGLLGTPDEPLLVDVREPAEVDAWSIPGVLNIPLGEIEARVQEIPTDRTVVMICASGNRSGHACRHLAARGLHATNLSGGMSAWGQVYDQADFEILGAHIVQVRRRGKGCLSYLVGADGEAFVIDPSIETDLYVNWATQRGWQITRVFDTHLHADHVSGARDLAERCGASLHLNPADSFEFPFTPLHDGDRFFLRGGTPFSVSVMHTPGHTQGSTIFVISDSAVLSGDTLFVNGVGRPDLAERAEEFARNLYHSLGETVLPLADDSMILPAHYSETVVVRPDQPVGARLGDLRTTLPPLSFDEESFVAWATARAVDRPPNYAEIIRANMGRVKVKARSAPALEEGPNRCSV